MTPALWVITVLLIPAGLIPVFVAWQIRPYRNSDSPSLLERWHQAVALAIVGGVTSIVALNVIFRFSLTWVWVVFGAALLTADIVSVRWYIEFRRGRFR